MEVKIICSIVKPSPFYEEKKYNKTKHPFEFKFDHFLEPLKMSAKKSLNKKGLNIAFQTFLGC